MMFAFILAFQRARRWRAPSRERVLVGRAITSGVDRRPPIGVDLLLAAQRAAPDPIVDFVSVPNDAVGT